MIDLRKMNDRLQEMTNEALEMRGQALSVIFENINQQPEETKQLFKDLLNARINGDTEEIERIENIIKNGK